MPYLPALFPIIAVRYNRSSVLLILGEFPPFFLVSVWFTDLLCLSYVIHYKLPSILFPYFGIFTEFWSFYLHYIVYIAFNGLFLLGSVRPLRGSWSWSPGRGLWISGGAAIICGSVWRPHSLCGWLVSCLPWWGCGSRLEQPFVLLCIAWRSMDVVCVFLPWSVVFQTTTIGIRTPRPSFPRILIDRPFG